MFILQPPSSSSAGPLGQRWASRRWMLSRVLAPFPPILIHWPNWGSAGRKPACCRAGVGIHPQRGSTEQARPSLEKAQRKMEVEQGRSWISPGRAPTPRIPATTPCLHTCADAAIAEARLPTGLGLKIVPCKGEGDYFESRAVHLGGGLAARLPWDVLVCRVCWGFSPWGSGPALQGICGGCRCPSWV